MFKYLTALYWSVVSATTVGYGDITPQNAFELLLSLMVIIMGVTMFTYMRSSLTSLFTNILSSASIKKVSGLYD